MGVRVSVERARGCGYRKEGGLYLCSGALSEPCPLLPFETHTCPTCGEGIKPARGYTWVDGEKFIPPVVHGTDEHDLVCPLSPLRNEVGQYAENADGSYVSRIGRCGLIWIGEQHYKTAREFMREAAEMGVSRRITAVPKDFLIGETWVLLGHRKAIERACAECGDLPESISLAPSAVGVESTGSPEREGASHSTGPDPDCPVCEGTGYEHRPGIVTAFKPTAIEYIVREGEEDDDEFLEGLEKRGITPVKVIRDTDQQSLEV
jgi:hypothetical protein